MRVRSPIVGVVSLSVAVLVGAACGADGSGEPVEPLDGGAETTSDTPAATPTLRIDPADVTLETILGSTAGTSATVKVFEKLTPTSAEVDVTASVTLSISDGALATTAGAVVTAGSRGGTGTLTASLADGAKGTANVKVKLTGEAFGPGFDASEKAKFTGAAVDPTATAQPKIEYPLEGTIVPSNVPPMEVQWTAGGDSTVYRVRATSPGLLDVAFYSKTREALFPTTPWGTVIATVAGADATLTVEGLGATGLHVSPPVKLTVARDRIDDSSIYYWESSSGSLKVLDFATGALATLPTKGSAYAPGSPGVCVACHTVSRDGARIAYTSGTFGLGTLKVSDDKKTYDATIEPGAKVTPGFKWTYGAFNPSEKTTVPALLVSKADPTAAQNVAGHVRLGLVDPDTGKDVPSNLIDWLAAFPSTVPRDLLQPDWSPSGVVVFAAYDSERANPSGTPAKAWVRDLGDDAVATSIVEAKVTWDGKAFSFGVPKVLVAPPASTSLDTWETNVLPQLSPDDAFVAFTRSKGWWPIRFQTDAVNGSGKVALVRRADGKVVELANASGPDDSNSTWPQWAPSVGADYAWIAFSTERPYGHRMAKGVALPPACIPQGRGLCKNMWITAIDRKKAASGDFDPSAAPFWMPGQTALASAVSPRWTKTAIAVK